MHPRFRIRSGRAEDADLLAVLASQVWLHTYATEGVTEEIARYVLSELTPRKYTEILNEPGSRLFVAEYDQGRVGFAVVRFGVPCPSGGSSTAELQTLYVQEHFMGRGIGKSLLHEAEAKAREQGHPTLWLTVNARNAKAIEFYAQQGYSQVGITHFVLGEQRHENHVLAGSDALKTSRHPTVSP